MRIRPTIIISVYTHMCHNLYHGHMEKQKMKMKMKWKLENGNGIDYRFVVVHTRFMCCWLSCLLGIPELFP